MTLLEAAKAVLESGTVSDIHNLRSAIRHEEDERRDFEALLRAVADDDQDALANAVDIAEQIEWRRKARAK